jgi:polyketide cyclase/dehydrase/lipid transport protein
MWSSTHSKTVKGLKAEQVWQVWTDVNQWHTWQPDIEHARLDGAFAAGNTFVLKPKGGPKVNIEIITAEPGSRFTDLTRFPGARMYGNHEFVVRGDELEIRTTMSIEGPLAWLWRKIVAEGVAKGMAAQTEKLVEQAANG